MSTAWHKRNKGKSYRLHNNNWCSLKIVKMRLRRYRCAVAAVVLRFALLHLTWLSSFGLHHNNFELPPPHCSRNQRQRRRWSSGNWINRTTHPVFSWVVAAVVVAIGSSWTSKFYVNIDTTTPAALPRPFLIFSTRPTDNIGEDVGLAWISSVPVTTAWKLFHLRNHRQLQLTRLYQQQDQQYWGGREVRSKQEVQQYTRGVINGCGAFYLYTTHSASIHLLLQIILYFSGSWV